MIGKLNYFAFGSNLSSPRLLQRLPGANAHCVAILAEHRLAWHKNGRDRSGKCDILHTGNGDDLVYGVVYLMTQAESLELDRYETADFGYGRKQVKVETLHGDIVEAFTYFARDIGQHQRPYHWYKEHVLRGALEHGFPRHYVEHIEATASKADHDEERHRRELSIYAEQA
jgi:hypothetical protein